MRKNKNYWKKRCELAEKVIELTGIVGGWEFVKWQSYVNHKSSMPWYDAPPPLPKKSVNYDTQSMA